MLISIKNDKFSAMVDTAGAQLISLKRNDDFQLLWQGDPKYWSENAPVLFPIVGALRNGMAKIGGEWYRMPMHGFAKDSEFTACDGGPDTVTLTLTSNGTTKALYPFDFEFKVSYTCTDRGFETKFTVRNMGKGAMPFVVGGHPGFNLPLWEGDTFEDYDLEFEVNEDQSCPCVDLEQCLIDNSRSKYHLKDQRSIPLTHELFAEDALIFENFKSKTVKLISRKSGHGLCMDISQFPMLGVWSSSNNGPYIALEPWVGCGTMVSEGDDLEKKKNMVFLGENETRSYAFSVSYF